MGVRYSEWKARTLVLEEVGVSELTTPQSRPKSPSWVLALATSIGGAAFLYGTIFAWLWQEDSLRGPTGFGAVMFFVGVAEMWRRRSRLRKAPWVAED